MFIKGLATSLPFWTGRHLLPFKNKTVEFIAHAGSTQQWVSLNQTLKVRISIPLLFSCVTLSKLLGLSVHRLTHL